MRVDEIERYLAKEMPPEERERFEKEMEENPSLKFDMQLVACVIYKTKENCLRRDRELVRLMHQGKPRARRRYVATVAVFFISTATLIASLLFGYIYLRKPKVSTPSSESVNRSHVEYYSVEKGLDDHGDRITPIQINNSLEVDSEQAKIPNDTLVAIVEQEQPLAEVLMPSEESEEKEEIVPDIVVASSPLPSIDKNDMKSFHSSNIEDDVFRGHYCKIDGVWGRLEKAALDKGVLTVDITLCSTKETKYISKKDIYESFIVSGMALYKLSDFSPLVNSELELYKDKEISIRMTFRNVKKRNLENKDGKYLAKILSFAAIRKAKSQRNNVMTFTNIVIEDE